MHNTSPSSGVHVCGDSKMSLEPGAGTPCVRRPLSALSQDSGPQFAASRTFTEASLEKSPLAAETPAPTENGTPTGASSTSLPVPNAQSTPSPSKTLTGKGKGVGHSKGKGPRQSQQGQQSPKVPSPPVNTSLRPPQQPSPLVPRQLALPPKKTKHAMYSDGTYWRCLDVNYYDPQVYQPPEHEHVCKAWLRTAQDEPVLRHQEEALCSLSKSY